MSSLELSQKREVDYILLGEFTAIPAGATKLIAIKSSAEPSDKTVLAADAVYDIPKSKQFGYSADDVQYNFQALSDIHIEHYHDNLYWKYSVPHLENALEVATQRDADFITVCGDAVNGYSSDNLTTEWSMYLQAIADSSYTGPVFETNGNHEIKGNGGKEAQLSDHELFKVNTGLNVVTEKMQDNTYYEMTAPTGDHFIFMTLEKGGAPNEYSEFSDKQLDWLEGLLTKYRGDGHRIFLYEHAPVKNYGAGDDISTPYYGGALNSSFPDVKRFMSILEANPQVIWFSGHTHIDFAYDYNISNMNGTTAYTVHIPSTSTTTRPIPFSYDKEKGYGANAYPQEENSSQGYFVDVYKNAVVLCGTDLVKNEILPLYTYMIDCSDNEQVESESYVPFEEACEKVTVTVDARAVAQNAKAVTMYLTGATGEILPKEVPMNKTVEGNFEAEVPSRYSHMMFYVNDGTNNIRINKEYEVDNCKITLGAIKLQCNNSFDNLSKNWVNAYVYVWVDGTETSAVKWPGIAMTKGSDGYFSANIPEGYDMFIFSGVDGSGNQSQSIDMTISDSIIAEKISDNYVLVEKETEPSTSSVPETTVVVSTSVTETTPDEPSVPVSSSTENNTDPIETSTAPADTDPTETSTSPTQTTVTETTQTTEPLVYLYGDADLDSKVSVKDATLIQKYVAELETLDDLAFAQAEVTGDGKVSIQDATAIQKFVALLVPSLPIDKDAEEPKLVVAEVGAGVSDLSSLINDVKKVLSEDSRFASYVAYANLKKACYAVKDRNLSSMTAAEIESAYALLAEALDDFNTMKTNNSSVEEGRYLLRGSMNNWDDSGVMKADGDKLSITYNLSAGSHKLKIYDKQTGKWYGNDGSFTDECSGWTMRDYEGDLIFNTTGGTYKFTIVFVGEKIRLTVEKTG